MQEYGAEILSMRSEGKTRHEICDAFGFNIKQLENFITNYNKRQQKIAAGIAIKRKGRPPKDYVVRQQDKIAELKYILARKDAKLKSKENVEATIPIVQVDSRLDWEPSMEYIGDERFIRWKLRQLEFEL